MLYLCSCIYEHVFSLGVFVVFLVVVLLFLLCSFGGGGGIGDSNSSMINHQVALEIGL